MFPNITDKVIGIDIETFDPTLKTLGPSVRRNGYILGVSIATLDQSFYFSLDHPNSQNVNKEHFYNWLNTLENKIFVGANILYDMDFLQYQGFFPKNKCIDIQYAEALIDENKLKYNLSLLCNQYLNEEKQEKEIEEYCLNKGWKGKPQEHLWKMSSSIVGKYCQADAQQALRIYYKQLPILQEQNLIDVFNMECDLIPLLLKMRKYGVRIDTEKLNQLKIDYTNKIKNLQYELNNMVGFELNINAARSIKQAYDKLKLPYGYTEKGNPSFAKLFLENDDSILAKKIIELRLYDKVNNTFISGLDRFLVNGRIHCLFHPLRGGEGGTVTGRFSASMPNLENQPSRNEVIKKDIRGLFIPEDGQDFGRGDYSQIELRILAHYARGFKADDIRQMYIDNPDIDFHQACADMIGVERKIAKNINFGVVYGMGRQKLCDSLGLSLEEGEQVLNNYYKKMPFLKQTSRDATDVATRRGYVRTILNRRRRFPDPRFAYKALNAIVQGTAAEVLKKSLVEAYKDGLFNILTPHNLVHDELNFSIPRTKEGLEATKELKYIFENSIKFKVPIIFELEKGTSWANLEPFEL